MIWDWAILGTICVATAIVAVALLAPRGNRNGHLTGLFRRPAPAVWLFDDDILIDATPAARAITGSEDTPCGWDDLRERLKERFPNFPATSHDPGRPVTLNASQETDRMQVECEWLGGITRVQLRRRPEAEMRDGCDLTEIPLLATAQAPYPVWQVDDDDTVTWHNAAYARLWQTARGAPPDPLTPLFPTGQDDPASGASARKSIFVADSDKRLWFDVSIVPHEGGRLCYAVDINAVVDAEIAQRNFVQTLAKTFAHLSIGLAIFDRNRQLVLFNPALIDLTALPADFLSARPNLLSFFDRLRDQRMMPEPKNYGSWRHQMADLVVAAADGRYQETWSLPSGSVYSVTGRPHPDGAVAFLFEDITAEITLTRRFRSDLELGQSILDQLDTAIAVFSVDGTMTFTNSAYHRMWGADPDSSFEQTAITDATRLWQDRCWATPLWGEIRDFVATRENRAEWFAEIRTIQGVALTCAVHPVHGGATMVSFTRSLRPALPAEPDAELHLAKA